MGRPFPVSHAHWLAQQRTPFDFDVHRSGPLQFEGSTNPWVHFAQHSNGMATDLNGCLAAWMEAIMQRVTWVGRSHLQGNLQGGCDLFNQALKKPRRSRSGFVRPPVGFEASFCDCPQQMPFTANRWRFRRDEMCASTRTSGWVACRPDVVGHRLDGLDQCIVLNRPYPRSVRWWFPHASTRWVSSIPSLSRRAVAWKPLVNTS